MNKIMFKIHRKDGHTTHSFPITMSDKIARKIARESIENGMRSEKDIVKVEVFDVKHTPLVEFGDLRFEVKRDQGD